MVLQFIGVNIINRTLHGRLEIRNFSSRVEKIFHSFAALPLNNREKRRSEIGLRFPGYNESDQYQNEICHGSIFSEVLIVITECPLKPVSSLFLLERLCSKKRKEAGLLERIYFPGRKSRLGGHRQNTVSNSLVDMRGMFRHVSSSLTILLASIKKEKNNYYFLLSTDISAVQNTYPRVPHLTIFLP